MRCLSESTKQAHAISFQLNTVGGTNRLNVPSSFTHLQTSKMTRHALLFFFTMLNLENLCRSQDVCPSGTLERQGTSDDWPIDIDNFPGSGFFNNPVGCNNNEAIVKFELNTLPGNKVRYDVSCRCEEGLTATRNDRSTALNNAVRSDGNLVRAYGLLSRQTVTCEPDGLLSSFELDSVVGSDGLLDMQYNYKCSEIATGYELNCISDTTTEEPIADTYVQLVDHPIICASNMFLQAFKMQTPGNQNVQENLLYQFRCCEIVQAPLTFAPTNPPVDDSAKQLAIGIGSTVAAAVVLASFGWLHNIVKRAKVELNTGKVQIDDQT